MYLLLIQVHDEYGMLKGRAVEMDTKFSVAIHMLILISESSVPLNSEQIAASVGTNASYIRKVLALLSSAGIVEGHRGRSGYALKIPPAELTMLQIYQAVTGSGTIHILDIHQNPSDQCLVGQHMKPVLTEMFADIEKSFAALLADRTLADCIANIKKEILVEED